MAPKTVMDLSMKETFVAHPTKKGVYVTPKHYDEIIKGDGADHQDCTYTETVVCSGWTTIPGSGPTCTQTTKVTTCRCRP